jgi:hypothetical protein
MDYIVFARKLNGETHVASRACERADARAWTARLETIACQCKCQRAPKAPARPNLKAALPVAAAAELEGRSTAASEQTRVTRSAQLENIALEAEVPRAPKAPARPFEGRVAPPPPPS